MQRSSATRDGAIGEKENGSDRVYLLLNLGRDALLVELALLSVGKARGIEDANLEKRSYILATLKNANTYHLAVLARKFVKADRLGPTLVGRSAILVGMVEDVVVVVINVFAVKDVGEEFQECRLSDTSLSKKKDGVWCIRLVRRCVDNSLLETLYVARNRVRTGTPKECWKPT